MIEHIVLLADETATLKLGGLAQLERLLHCLEEYFDPAKGDRLSEPDVTVLWRSAPPRRAWPGIRLRVTHLSDPNAVPANRRTGATLLLRTNVVFGRETLHRLLLARQNGTPLALAPFAVMDGLPSPLEWDQLARRLPSIPGGTTDVALGFVGVIAGPADVSPVERALFRSLGKPMDGLVARHLNRPISTRLSRVLARIGVTPNQASFAVLGCLAASAWMLVGGTPFGFVAGTLCYKLASVLDGCDGEIARVKFLESRFGAWVDNAVDIFGHQLFVVALGVGLWRSWAPAPRLASTYLWEGILTGVGIALNWWLLARYNERTTGADHFNDFGSSVVDESPLPGWLRRLGYLVAQLTRRDSYALIFVLFALAGHPDWILHALAIGVAAHFPAVGWLWWRRIGLPVASDAGTVTEA